MPGKVVRSYDWPAEDRPGQLLKTAEELARRKVDLLAIWGYTDPNKVAKIAAIAKKPAKLESALKEMGIEAKTSNCLYLTGTDRVGALLKPLGALAGAGINITCLDAVAVRGGFAATIWVADADLEKAKKLLKIK